MLLQHRDPTLLKTITKYIITIWPNIEKVKGFKGQLEIKVLINICKKVYNVVIV